MESSSCSRCIGLRSALFGLSVLLQDCNPVSPLYANLHYFPCPAPAKKYGRNLYTPHRQTPFHYARPSADTEPQDNDGRQRDRELQLPYCDTAAVPISLAAFADGNQHRQELSSTPSTPVFNVAPAANSELLDTRLQCATHTRCEIEGTFPADPFPPGEEKSPTKVVNSTLVNEQLDPENQDFGDEDQTTQWDLLARGTERRRLKKRRRNERKRQAKQALLDEEKEFEEVLAKARVKLHTAAVKPTTPPLTPEEQAIAARRERQDRSCKDTVKKHSVNIGEFRGSPNCRSKPGSPPQILERPNINVAMHSLTSTILANKQQEGPAISDAAPTPPKAATRSEEPAKHTTSQRGEQLPKVMWIARSLSENDNDEPPPLQSDSSDDSVFWDADRSQPAHEPYASDDIDNVRELFALASTQLYACEPPAKHVLIAGKTLDPATAAQWTYKLTIRYRQCHHKVRDLQLQKHQKRVTTTFNDILTSVGHEDEWKRLSQYDEYEALFFKSEVILDLSKPSSPTMGKARPFSRTHIIQRVALPCRDTLVTVGAPINATMLRPVLS